MRIGPSLRASARWPAGLRGADVATGATPATGARVHALGGGQRTNQGSKKGPLLRRGPFVCGGWRVASLSEEQAQDAVEG